MEWREVWRKGIAPLLSPKALEALQQALQADDYRLIQGATTAPPPLCATQDWPVEAACALGYCGWQGENLERVANVEEYFAQLCFNCDRALNEPAAVRFFLNWADETPRYEMISRLLPEVTLALENHPCRVCVRPPAKSVSES